jgi:hypothetical protein
VKRLALIVTACLAAGPSTAGLPESWRSWRYFRPIDAPSGAERGLVRVSLPLEVVGRAQPTFADLRVIDDRGTEVPHVLHARVGRRTVSWRATALSEVGFVAGEYTQAVVDTGTSAELHNTIEVEIADRDFFTWAQVAASDDREVWVVLRERAPLFRFDKEDLQGTRTISYPDTRARWLRLHLTGNEKRNLRSVRVAEEVIEEAEHVPLPARPTLERNPPEGESVWVVDLAHAHVPVSVVRCETERLEFHRPVRVSASDDGESWNEVAQGEIHRHGQPVAEGAEARERQQLRVRFDEARGRHWRIAVVNRNDTPIDDLRCELLWTPRHVVFRPVSGGGGYRLLYGNHRASPPAYELARLTTRDDREQAAPADLGLPSVNEDYVSPEPWSERHPGVLWLALGLATVVLGWLALRSLRRR